MDFNSGKYLSALQDLVKIGNRVNPDMLINNSCISKVLFSYSQRGILNQKVIMTFQKILTEIQESEEISPMNVSSSDVLFLSSNGKILAIGSKDGTVKLRDWQNQNQQNLDQFQISNLVVSSFNFSPNGQILAIGSKDGTVRLRDWQKKQNLDQFQALDQVLSLSFSPNGQILAVGSKDGTVRLRDWQKKQNLDPFQALDQVLSLSFSPNGQILAVSSSDDNKVQFWDWQKGQKLDEFPVSGSVLSLSFSPDGQILVIGLSDDITLATSKGKVELWDWQKEQQLGEFIISGHVSNFSFSPDGNTLITTSTKDNSVFIERRTVYKSLDEMLNQSCKLLKPYLESHPDKKEELGCPVMMY